MEKLRIVITLRFCDFDLEMVASETRLGCQGQHIHVKDITDVSGPLQKCPEYLRLVGDTKDMSRTPKVYQGHNRCLRDTTDVSGTPHTYQGHQRGVKDISDLF